MLLVLISDLETNQPSLIRALKIALRKRHRVIVVSPFSWTYHLNKDNLTEDRLERAYGDLKGKQKLLESLTTAGIRVIEIGPNERGEKVMENLRRMSR